MRSVDTSLLRPLKAGGFGPWLLEDDRLLKAFVHGEPLLHEADARGLFETYRAARDAGANVPRPLEVVRVGDSYGVVVEYVRGLTMLRHLAFGSFTPKEAGEAMGALMRRLHDHRCVCGRDINATFRRRTRLLAPLLGPKMAQGLESLVESHRNGNVFLHGDLHPDNVVVRGAELTPVDLDLAGFGHPIFDLAATRTRLLLNNHVPLEGEAPIVDEPTDLRWCEAMQELWRSLLATYCAQVVPSEVDEVDRRTAIFAEVEHCCFRYGIAGGGGLTARQRCRLELCARRLATLLPQASQPSAAQWSQRGGVR